ncbi:MAG: hypothetical protein ABI540_07925 [Spartobacteria bacterium]
MLFERLVVHDTGDTAGAALNMAIDESLLENAAAEPVLRFYGWARPSLSFGYFGRFADVAAEAARRDIVRRWTGGGIVLHGDDLTYSLMTPAGDPASRLGPPAIYAALHEAIRLALLAEGCETRLAAVGAPRISDACFANPVRFDLLLDGRKVAGAAQRRTRRGFLHQGSIQVPHLSERFRERFASGLAGNVEWGKLPAPVIERATTLVSEKYATATWLHRC